MCDKKICTKCGLEKEAKYFSKAKHGKLGLKSQCKECLSGMNKNYFIRNKERLLKKPQNKWRNKNVKKAREYAKTYFKTKKGKLSRKKTRQKRLDSDSLFRLHENIRGLIRKSIKGCGYNKKSKTYKILGCDKEEFKKHIESLFEPWMNWENKGGRNIKEQDKNKFWDLDHVIPISSAKTEEDIVKLNHYTNFQPLCSYTNRYLKIDKLDFLK